MAYFNVSFVKNTIKLYNKLVFSNFKRLYTNQCWPMPFTVIKPSVTRGCKLLLINNPFEGAYVMRCHSTKVAFDEMKLERFLKNLSWNQLESSYNIKLDQTHEKLVTNLIAEKVKLEELVKELETMKDKEAKNENNKEMMDLIEGDLTQYHTELTDTYEKIIDIILPRGDFEDCNDVVLEISAGVGGSEAQLFAYELYNMYFGFLNRKSWENSLVEFDRSDLGGVRHCSLLVSGPGAYSTLQHEAGVHRVQRVPETEKSSRMHTSTVTVAILPQPTEVEIEVKDTDLRIETKRATGAGGQHVNTTDSAVRITHLPSGIVVECQTDRSQIKNKETALKKLRAKLYEQQLQKADSLHRSHRKSQVGSSARSEKIRTYNFRDDRISDHRLSVNLHNMRDFLQGGEQFERLLEQLIKWHHESQIKYFVDSLPS